MAEGESKRKRKSRMTLPKKREDLDKVVQEVSERHHEHDHHHHHHHHGDIDELLTVIELLIDSLNANVKVLETNVKRQAGEIALIYRVLASIVKACLAAESEEERKAALQEALRLLEPALEAARAEN